MADVGGDKIVGVHELPEPSGTHATFNDPEEAAQDDADADVDRVERVYK
jgi:hypothetical protein